MNIKRILNTNNIEFREEGKNVASGNINICCPYCANDEGFHLGINPRTKVWGCWRNSTHRGKNLQYLLIKLLNITEDEAARLCGTSFVNDDIFTNLFNKLKNEPEIKKIDKLEFLPSFKKIKNFVETKRFYEYLYSRGFHNVNEVIEKNNLLCCLVGDYSFRIIIPIYMDNKLVTWTSRSIYSDINLRYKDLEKENSIIPIKQTLFNYDSIKNGGDVLIINEGPFDSMKINSYLGSDYKATCLFTKHMSKEQEYLLADIIPKYRKVILLLDKGEFAACLHIHKKFEYFNNFYIKNLPNNLKDSGELSIRNLNSFTKIL